MDVALVTGASRGFGLALARELHRRGSHLLVDGRDPERLEAAAAEIGPTRITALAGDVGDPEHRADLAAAAHRLGRLDLLVNNASILGPSPLPRLERYPIADLEEVYRVNTVAPLALIQGLLPLLVASSGAIVNVTSDAAREPYEGWGGYGSSKAALDQLGNVLGAEEPDVRVYTFDPGDMRTQMQQDAYPGEDISDRPPPEESVPGLLALIEGSRPSGRYRAADLVAAAP